MTTKLIKGKDNSSSSLLLLHPTGLQGVSDHSSRTEATKYSAVNVTPISLPVHAHTHTRTHMHTHKHAHTLGTGPQQLSGWIHHPVDPSYLCPGQTLNPFTPQFS